MIQESSSRDTLIAAILRFLSVEDLLTQQDIRAALEREIDAAGPDAVVALKARLAADDGWAYYPPDPLARRIHHLLADRFLAPDSVVLGAEHIDSVAGEPAVLFSNHLSYADANVIDILLERSGGATLATRLTAIAGPKVFSDSQRRFSSLCFGTVKVPQSAEVASEEAVQSARDVARAARRSIDVARQRLSRGDALVLFAEGTRSRTGEMQPMLAGVARYLGVTGTWVLPVGLTGPDQLFPVGDATLHPAPVAMRLGRPFPADALVRGAAGNRRVVMDAIGLAVAELVPVACRGFYADAGRFPAAVDALRRSRA